MPYIDRSKTDDWKTPSKIYEQIMQENYFDPCPFKSDFDGLAIPWGFSQITGSCADKFFGKRRSREKIGKRRFSNGKAKVFGSRCL